MFAWSQLTADKSLTNKPIIFLDILSKTQPNRNIFAVKGGMRFQVMAFSRLCFATDILWTKRKWWCSWLRKVKVHWCVQVYSLLLLWCWGVQQWHAIFFNFILVRNLMHLSDDLMRALITKGSAQLMEDWDTPDLSPVSFWKVPLARNTTVLSTWTCGGIEMDLRVSLRTCSSNELHRLVSF